MGEQIHLVFFKLIVSILWRESAVRETLRFKHEFAEELNAVSKSPWIKIMEPHFDRVKDTELPGEICLFHISSNTLQNIHKVGSFLISHVVQTLEYWWTENSKPFSQISSTSGL